MDVCPITFSAGPPLLPSFWPSIYDWVYADPLLTCSINWGEDMDQTVEPLPAEFELTVDDVIKTPLAFLWTSATNFTIVYSEAILGPTVVRLHYETSSPRLISLAGEIVTPFDLLIDPP